MNYLTPINNDTLEKDFLCACQMGNLNTVKNIVKKNKDIDIHIKNPKVLNLAFNSGNLDLVKYLLESPQLKSHPVLDFSKDYGFIQCARSGYIHILEYFLNYPDFKNEKNRKEHEENNHKALIEACIFGKLEVIKYLLKKDQTKNNLDIHYQKDSAFRWALMREQRHVIDYFIYELKIPYTSHIENSLRNINKNGTSDEHKVAPLAKEVMNIFHKIKLNESLHDQLNNKEIKIKFKL